MLWELQLFHILSSLLTLRYITTQNTLSYLSATLKHQRNKTSTQVYDLSLQKLCQCSLHESLLTRLLSWGILPCCDHMIMTATQLRIRGVRINFNLVFLPSPITLVLFSFICDTDFALNWRNQTKSELNMLILRCLNPNTPNLIHTLLKIPWYNKCKHPYIASLEWCR